MKLTLLFSFLLFMTSWGTSLSQTRLTLNLSNTPINEFIQTVEDKTDYYFLYQDHVFRTGQKVTIHSEDEALESILDQMADQAFVEYKIIDRQIVILPSGQTNLPEVVKNMIEQQPQKRDVSGTVSDSSGAPLPGVTVVVKGTTIGTTTNSDGKFVLSLPTDAQILEVSFVGMKMQEISIAGKSTVRVVMEQEILSVDEVVVVGYGTLRKQDVTGSVASVSGAKLQQVQTANLTSQMKGRTAGVDIVSNSSNPGASGQIRIRGERSLTGTNDPLLVVDGIPYSGNINDLNPNDIVSVDILKDASATAVYGSRGSNGILMVTTKRGKAGKALFTFDSSYGVSSIMDELRVFTGNELAAFKAEAASGNTVNPNTNPYGLTTAETAGLASGTNTNWQKLIFQKGFTSNQQLNVSGGNESTLFSMGMGYYNETGIIPHQKFERYNLRSTIDHKISGKLKVGLNSMNTLTFSNIAGNPVGNLLNLSPLAAPYNTDGTINLYPMKGHIDEMVYLNPLTIDNKDAISNSSRRMRSFNSLYGEWSILQSLKYRLNLGLDFSQTQGGSYYGPNTLFNAGTTLAQARANVNNNEFYSYTIENLLLFDKTFGKHKVGFTGLYSVQKDHTRSSNFDGLGIPNDIIQNTNMYFVTTLTAPNTNNFLIEKGLISYMARINYGYDNRYLLTASLRRDGASVLSPGHQYFTYPAIALAWNISNEQFFKNIPAITNLKLRAGWGKTANAGINPYSTLGALSTVNYNFGTSGLTGFLVSTLANKSLKWESTEQSNLGLDFGFFKNRISGTIDVYNQKTEDILLGMSLPRSNGAGSVVVNAGKTKGRGIEINISTINFELNNGFKWITDFTFSINRNEISALQNPTLKADVGNGWFVGQPLTVIYDLKKIGIWQTADATVLATQITPKQFVGQIRIEDLNKDFKIDANDRQIIGNFEPKWIGGFTSTFSFKGIELSAVLYSRIGMLVGVPYVTADGGAQGYPMFMQSRRNQLKVDYWTPNNPTNKFPRPDASKDNPMFGSTLGYIDGSFVKIRTIDLSYNIPSKYFAKSGINSLKVFVNILNPLVLYSPFVKEGYGPDPEGNGYGGTVTSPLAGGSTSIPGRAITVNANTPSTRQVNFGLNLKF
ncbi:MAG: TonB-dependent receptor [Bacteroidota bacterium]|nr:TonB-dependent receptor [Bacteroidota bacterium]